MGERPIILRVAPGSSRGRGVKEGWKAGDSKRCENGFAGSGDMVLEKKKAPLGDLPDNV